MYSSHTLFYYLSITINYLLFQVVVKLDVNYVTDSRGIYMYWFLRWGWYD